MGFFDIFKTKRKYTFVEFQAAMEGEDFDVLEESWVDHYRNYNNNHTPNSLNDVHSGDCTKSCHTCDLCLLEYNLKEYREYFFDEAAWRKKYLG